VAGQRTEAAYEAIYEWQDANCPIRESDRAFCEQWRPYEQLVNRDPEVDEELIAQVLAMEEGLQAIVPGQLQGDLAASIDWNARFIEWYERNDYRQPTTEEDLLDVFDGDEALADAVREEREAAFPNIEAWIDANCGGDDESPTALPARFCAAWDELAALTADDGELDEAQWERLGELIDVAGADVPAAVADDWAAITDFVDRYGDVLVSVEFREERITDQMLEQAFGSVEAYDEAVAARDAAGAEVGQWSLDGCGDFCARWSDMGRVTEELGYWLQWVVEEPESGEARLDSHLRTLELLDQLVADEIRETWTMISAAYRDWVDRWERAGFDPERLEDVVQSEAVDWARSTPYLSARIDAGEDSGFYARAFEEWQAGASQVPEWVYEERWPQEFDPDRLGEIREELEASDHGLAELIALFDRDELPEWLREMVGMPPADLTVELMGQVQAWVDANCAASTSRPGSLRVLWPRVEGRAGGTVIMALLPPGGIFDDLADVPSTIAAHCEGVGGDPWGVWIEQHDGGMEEGRHTSDFFRDERWSEDRLCGFHHDGEPPRIDAGQYTLVGGIMWGDPGDPAEGIDLVSCVAIDVQIDSDTIVDLPPFAPCDVRIGGGEPDPWRNPAPVDPSRPGAGTLRIELESIAMPPPFEDHNGSLDIVVLPAGTTLNEIGRQQAWPVGAASTQLSAEQHTDERWGAAHVPIAALPASGRPAAFAPDWLAQDPPDEKLPLTVLAPGSYDIHVQIWTHTEEEQSLCGVKEVVIDGDTVVGLPELGQCP